MRSTGQDLPAHSPAAQAPVIPSNDMLFNILARAFRPAPSQSRMPACWAVAVLALGLSACSSGSGGDEQNPPGGGGGGQSASGILTLSGTDTVAIGTEFIIGDGAREESPGMSVGHIFVDAPKMFTATDYGLLEFDPLTDIIGFDDQDMTIFVVAIDSTGTALGLSMNFLVGGIPHRYSCITIAGSGQQNCGDVVYDEAAGEIRFNGVIVEPDTGDGATDFLTIDGIITWNE